MSRSIPSIACTPVRALVILFVIFCSGIPAVSAADASYVGELGDTIALHGVSYTGTQVFLFMTGPDLPATGVTLTDVTQRADQGYFTIVDLDSNQQWSMKWNTQRIHNEIDPGTYTVYVVNEPVDKAHLGSSSSYQTLSVYLKDPKISQGTSGGGTSYTLNLNKDDSTVIPTTVPVTPTIMPATSLTTPPATASPTPVPTTTRAALHPLTTLIAVIGIVGFLLGSKPHS
jgi:hypothetical protein